MHSVLKANKFKLWKPVLSTEIAELENFDS